MAKPRNSGRFPKPRGRKGPSIINVMWWTFISCLFIALLLLNGVKA